MKAPEKNFVSFYRTEGNYNLLDPREKHIQYVITGIDRETIRNKGLTISFLVNPDYDGDFDSDRMSPLELLDELEYIYKNRYWINTRLSDIKPLREYLESIEEEQKKLRRQYEIDYAKYQIKLWSAKLRNMLEEWGEDLNE